MDWSTNFGQVNFTIFVFMSKNTNKSKTVSFYVNSESSKIKLTLLNFICLWGIQLKVL